jgi:CubicO group peptidase (beta-lactamase class C family)
MKRFRAFVCLVVFSALSVVPGTAQDSTAELAGLWHAERRFGPEVRGTLILTRTSAGWRGEIAGRVADLSLAGDSLAFELPDGKGSFRGTLEAQQARIVGHWIQPATVEGGPYASPVILTRSRPDEWRGIVTPLESKMTFYMMITAREDGSAGAFLRNPERNVGFIQHQYPVDGIEREGEAVRLVAADDGTAKRRVLAEGRYDAAGEILSVYFPKRGGTFDFRRVGANEPSDFYPRGRPTVPYTYRPPIALDDGWPTASLEDVGISRAGIQQFIQMIVDTPMDSVKALEVHGVLIARHGKLVLEEYFHGEHREKAHDTRSASKSLASDLAGAAIHSGFPLKASSHVYEVMNGGAFPPGLEPRKRSLTLEHLLTMSSGLDCDDDDEKSPGYEDNVQGPDLYKSTMALGMIREPGEKTVYCSVNSNLVVGVVSRGAKRRSPELFRTLIAEPLQIERYYMGITPTDDYYMGGGARFLPRDFMKIGQLHVNGGTWNGRSILSPEWSRRATSPLTRFSETSKARYGYLWWVYDFPYKGRMVQAYFASGNGGQFVIGIAELDLVIAAYGGNYNDWDTGYHFLLDYVPNYILPAVEEAR